MAEKGKDGREGEKCVEKESRSNAGTAKKMIIWAWVSILIGTEGRTVAGRWRPPGHQALLEHATSRTREPLSAPGAWT